MFARLGLVRNRRRTRRLLGGLAALGIASLAIAMQPTSVAAMTGGGCYGPFRTAGSQGTSWGYGDTSPCISGVWGTDPSGVHGAYVLPDGYISWHSSSAHPISWCTVWVKVYDDTTRSLANWATYNCTNDFRSNRHGAHYGPQWSFCGQGLFNDPNGDTYHTYMYWHAGVAGGEIDSNIVSGPRENCV